MRFRAWLVDLDGTLYHAAPVRVLMAAELLFRGPSTLRALAAFRRAQETLRLRPTASPDPFARQLAIAARGLALPVSELEALVRRFMIERPGPWLRAFRRRSLLREVAAFRGSGGRCAIVSDYPARAKLQAIGAASLFDAVVAAGEPGGPHRLKPDPEGCLRAASALRVAPADCLVIGDRDEIDGAAARAAGMAFRRIGSAGSRTQRTEAESGPCRSRSSR